MILANLSKLQPPYTVCCMLYTHNIHVHCITCINIVHSLLSFIHLHVAGTSVKKKQKIELCNGNANFPLVKLCCIQSKHLSAPSSRVSEIAFSQPLRKMIATKTN